MTKNGGLVIIDSRGRLKEIFNKAYGLQDDNVRYVLEDSQGNLWLALSKGISKIENISPFSIYDEKSSLHGNVQTVVKHQNHLYVGTDRGLFLLASPHEFRPAAGISSNCWALLSIDDSLLVATTGGLFRLKMMIKEELLRTVLMFCFTPQRIQIAFGWERTRDWILYTAKTSNGQRNANLEIYPKK